MQPRAWPGEDRQDDWVVGDEVEEARGVALGYHQGRVYRVGLSVRPGAWLGEDRQDD